MSAPGQENAPPQGSADAAGRGRPKHQDTELHARKGYESLDAAPGATFRAGLYILGVMFLTAAVLVPLYRLFARGERQSQPRPATVIQARPTAAAVAYPKLVVSEPDALSEFRAREDFVLGGYGWVEKDRAIARMPVSEAIRIVGARGKLPTIAGPDAGVTLPAGGAAAPPGADAAGVRAEGGAR